MKWEIYVRALSLFALLASAPASITLANQSTTATLIVSIPSRTGMIAHQRFFWPLYMSLLFIAAATQLYCAWRKQRAIKYMWLSCLLPMVLVPTGCGSGSNASPPPPPPPPSPAIAIVFDSQAALDGSDAPNTNGFNCPSAPNGFCFGQNIWGVSADGTFAMALTKDTAPTDTPQFIQSADPVWSLDGKKIAFVSNRPSVGPDANPSNDIWVMNADGSGLTGLTTVGTMPVGGGAGDPNWSPDGLKLAFTSLCCGISPEGGVSVMLAADGSIVASLVQCGANNFSGLGPSDAHWSPDGTKLVFESPCATDGSGLILNANNTLNVWVMNSDLSSPTPLTKVTATNADCLGAVWSPDGSKIAFISARALDGSDTASANNTSNVWVVNANGTGLTPLTNLTAVAAGATAPAWSPDGSKIAFESSRSLDGSNAANANTTVNIWVINTDGTGPTPLTKLVGAGASSHLPDWSPNGSKLAFESTRATDGQDSANAASNIWIMNADGSGATPLTKNTAKGAGSNQPKWRP